MKELAMTIFTPSYNRAYILPQLYESLKQQSVKDFEWMIVDDGSTDHTQELVTSWIEESEFEIIYIKVKNGGKHRAINKGVRLARGNLFFIVDSDDYLMPQSVERILYWETTIQDKPQFAGVAGNKGKSKDELVGTTFGGTYLDATSLEREKYKIEGDKAEVFYTRVLREYPFPEIEGENFMTECVVWFHIAHDGYKLRWFNEIIYICDYLDDGLTKNYSKLVENNPSSMKLAWQLNQKFLDDYLKKEKNELVSKIKQLLIQGNVSVVLKLIENTFDRLKNDLDVQLIKVTLFKLGGDQEEAISLLKKLWLSHPNSLKILIKQAELLEGEDKRQDALPYYLKALSLMPVSSKQAEWVELLKKRYQLSEAELFPYRYLKQLKDHQQNEEAVQFILNSSSFFDVFKQELKFYQNQAYYQQYIISLLCENGIGYPINDLAYDYIYGHTYFNAGLYEKSLHHLMKIERNQLSPLVAYRLSVLYDLFNHPSQASLYLDYYQNFSKSLS